ncbi:armadillo-type protein [Xylaria bambusicola]|uniref:armadillo-type protein n=1 Tax=Xylaria bambusicola TaxID=326684 RepID=UPI00200769B1|nr:armadillo-type protein [Xylaria bambusicola]KAI0508322.1 armadillo-type protein [Xylaria bambusicola]
MSVARSTGSPTLRRTPGSKTSQMDENTKVGKEDFSIAAVGDQLKSLLIFEPNGQSSQKRPHGVLSASSLVNQSCPNSAQPNLETFGTSEILESSLTNSSPPRLARQLSGIPPIGSGLNYSVDANDGLKLEHTATSSSVPITPATDMFGNACPITRPASATMNESATSDEEVLRLKFELAQAQSKISRLDQELASTRHGHVGLSQPTSVSPVENGFSNGHQQAPPVSRPPSLHPANTNTHYMGREGGRPWPGYDDSRSDTSDALSATGFNSSRNIWGSLKQTPSAVGLSGPPPLGMPQNGPWSGRAASHSYVEPSMSYDPATADNFRAERLTPDFDFTTKPPGSRRNNRYDARFGGQGFNGTSQSYNTQPGYCAYPYPQGQYDPGVITSGGSQNNMNTGVYANYQSPPVGTSLSPLASEFTSMSGSAGPWKSEPTSTEGQTYLPTTEPLNYRRLLDRNVNCNWKYIVDKIVCSNDQQASIFLQQKLKVGTPDQKYEIVEAIVAQAYPLMVNRFGNFLVQRCFEHGTPEQVIKIAEAIRGCTLTLSMDPFGCHVVQKAFDSVPEDYKAIMVHELLRRIPETVIHRYACHVWQKLFELRWTESPPQIMKYVNEALRGMWHEVALGETGSLVVQNIFENCLEEDKRPCIEEVLSNIDIVAHGQFGNWCIQHICEHGAPADRSRAIDHVIRYAAEYSMDQYASKVVEKCLKIGGAEFLTRYLDRVCEGRIDRPRIPLIDIASDQYGNYLIQWILQHANPQHKEIVAAHIRKHMVSLRGSKFGSRVGMLCTNPAIATRPGPGVGPGVGRMPAGPRYGGRGFQ